MKKLTLLAREEHQGKRLDQVLAEWLPVALSQPVSKAKSRKLIVAGAVYMNGQRVRIASKEIRKGTRVEAYVDLRRLSEDATSADQIFEMKPSDILFEDEFLIAVNKPAGLPTQPTLDEARNNLFASVKKFLAARERNPEAYVGLHHRLDRDTSGVVLLTKKPEANAGTAELFSGHLARKTYLALTVRPSALPPAEWVVKNYLARDKAAGKNSRFHSVKSGGDFAHTDFRLVEAFGDALLIEARPLTGRTHQIRVHLSEAGLPILFDATYGDRAASREPGRMRMMLHAARLTFPHPIHKSEISIASPLPEDFNECLHRFRSACSPVPPGGGSLAE